MSEKNDALLFQISADIGTLKADVGNIKIHVDVLNDEHGQLLTRVTSLETKLMSADDQKKALNNLKNSIRNWILGAATVISAVFVVAGYFAGIIH